MSKLSGLIGSCSSGVSNVGRQSGVGMLCQPQCTSQLSWQLIGAGAVTHAHFLTGRCHACSLQAPKQSGSKLEAQFCILNGAHNVFGDTLCFTQGVERKGNYGLLERLGFFTWIRPNCSTKVLIPGQCKYFLNRTACCSVAVFLAVSFQQQVCWIETNEFSCVTTIGAENFHWNIKYRKK